MCPPCAALSMANLEQLKLKCPLPWGMLRVGLSRPSPRLSSELMLVTLVFEPRVFRAIPSLPLSFLGANKRATIYVI